MYHPIFRQNKISASDQDKRGKVASTILDLIDLRNYNEQHRCFQRKDGSYIDFLKSKPVIGGIRQKMKFSMIS